MPTGREGEMILIGEHLGKLDLESFHICPAARTAAQISLLFTWYERASHWSEGWPPTADSCAS
jgi:hypothetical protein